MVGILLSAQNQSESFCGTKDVDPWLDEYFANMGIYATEESEVIYVPLTIHILGTDEGEGYYRIDNLYESLCTLNKDFEDTQIQFYIQEPINYINKTSWYDHPNFAQGIEMMRQSNVTGTANCYIVANPAGNCGYYAGNGNAIALRKGCTDPTDHTWAHELGHFFSLPHTFVGWEGIRWEYGKSAEDYEGAVRRQIERVNGTNCDAAADRFCDTPPDYLSYRWNCNGNSSSNEVMLDPDSISFQADGSYFMSYSNDACMNRFSFEQMQAMRANINSQRPELANESLPEPVINDLIPENTLPTDSSVIPPFNSTLSWDPVPGATHYIIELSRLPNFSFIIERERINTNVFELPDLIPGIRYYWRVKAMNNNSFCTSYTDRHMFTTSSLTATTTELENISWNMGRTVYYPGEALNLVISSDKAMDLQWSVFTVNGQLLDNGNLMISEGRSVFELPVNTQSFNGHLFIRLTNGKQQSVRRCMVLK